MDTPLTLAFTLSAIVGLAVVAWTAVRHLTGLREARSTGGGIRLLQSRPLGARTRLLVVGYRDREYLLGVTADRVSVLDRLPSPAAADAVSEGGAPSGWDDDPDGGATLATRRRRPDR